MNKHRNEIQCILWHKASEPPADDTWALIMLDAFDDSGNYLYAYSNPYMGFWEVRGRSDWCGRLAPARKVFWNDVYAWFPVPAPATWNDEDDKN